jgi:hypothetical protein
MMNGPPPFLNQYPHPAAANTVSGLPFVHNDSFYGIIVTYWEHWISYSSYCGFGVPGPDDADIQGGIVVFEQQSG